MIALALCRVRYGADWFATWLTFVRWIVGVALADVAFIERKLLYSLWLAAPFLISLTLASVSAWVIVRWRLRKGNEEVLFRLALKGDTTNVSGNQKEFRGPLLYWALINIVLLCSSIVLAARK